MVRIGMLRHFKKPNNIVLAAALAAYYRDAEFFFFNPENVDFERKKILGMFFKEGRWVKQETDFPHVVDNSPSTGSTKLIYEKLQKEVPFTTHRIGNKDQIYKRLKKEKVYEHLLIPTKNVNSRADVFNYLTEYRKVVMKPKRGNRGRGIHCIENKKDCYIVNSDKHVREMNSCEFDEFLETILINQKYIVQPYIKCFTKDSLPFDIRVHVRRDVKNKWKIVKIYPRVGTSDGITSNLSQGGYIGKLDAFLFRQFGPEHLSVQNELERLGKEFPEYFQKGFSEPIDAIGIDVGIDENRKMWLFEVNSYPGSTFFEIESQFVAMGYAKYLAEKSFGSNPREN